MKAVLTKNYLQRMAFMQNFTTASSNRLLEREGIGMKYRYITIEREYGSGGTLIARRLAEKCSVPCYGQEILEAVSKKFGVSVEQIQKYEENVNTSFLYTAFMIGRAQEGNADMLSTEGHIFVAEQEEIQHLAASGPAIFVGHCASEALKDRKALNVFIRCSDEEEKKKRIAQDYGIHLNNVENTCRRFDSKRSKYYFANTTKKWENLKNYDLVLDSAKLGIDGCVDILKSVLAAEN